MCSQMKKKTVRWLSLSLATVGTEEATAARTSLGRITERFHSRADYWKENSKVQLRTDEQQKLLLNTNRA